jgi:branched-chain amino acid transport system ATP-binding protein
MPALLRVRDVEARYDRFVALDGVSLVVPEGSVVALLGPNGVGKTTMLRTVSGMLPPTRGEITFDGVRIDGLPDHAVARMGIAHIPEGRGIFPGLSVRENLLMATYGIRHGEHNLEGVFRLFPILRERRHQTAGTLSGGEQQMLSLARAVVTRPRLLMLDELSLGLAPRLVSQLFDTVREIRDEGTTILLVEQYVGHALRLADIVVVLHKGQVRFIGEPGELEHEDALVESYLGQAGTETMALTQAASPKRSRARGRSKSRPGGRTTGSKPRAGRPRT